MANKKITDLDALITAASDDYLEIVDASEGASKKISHFNLIGSGKAADSDKLDGLNSTDFGRPVFLTTHLTSNSWDGDSFSTTAKTKIDLSTVFGVPAGVKAVLVRMAARDSSASTYDAYFGISPNDTSADLALNVRLQGHENDQILEQSLICPCDANGDIYYQTKASGTNTLDCWLWVWGYFL